MTTEHLIEEARNGDFEDRGWMIDIIDRLAHALVVAEEAHTLTCSSVNVTSRHSTSVTNSEAHTPTNDERETLEAKAWGEQYTPGMSQKEASAFKRGHAAGWRDAGFRRSEVPEPSRQLRECTVCGEKVTLSNATEEWENRHVHTESQGESSSDVESDPLYLTLFAIAKRAIGDEDYGQQAWHWMAHDVTLWLRKSEPSDAQVEAALQALGHARSGVTTPVMRAALRAASAVTKQGEPSDATLGIMAQRFYEASGLSIPHTAKPDVVAGLRAALRAAGGVR